MASTLNITIPIIQAPMAGVQDWRLAAAVASAGALGSLPCGMLSADQVVAEVAAFRQATSAPLNLNFFCHTMAPLSKAAALRWQQMLAGYYDELSLQPSEAGALRMPYDDAMAEVVAELKPDVVSFHFGLPDAGKVDALKSAGVTVLSTATTLEEALWLQDHGVDMIIAQGVEAGGHRGMFLSQDLASQQSTRTLLQELQGRVSVPVIAAGGIGSAADIEQMLQLGASYVQLGTAYLLCDEAKTSEVYRQALIAETSVTALTNVFSGRPARGICNRLMRDLGNINNDVAPYPYASAALAPLKAAAEAQGRGDFSSMWAGENRAACRTVGAQQLTLDLWCDMQALKD